MSLCPAAGIHEDTDEQGADQETTRRVAERVEPRLDEARQERAHEIDDGYDDFREAGRTAPGTPLLDQRHRDKEQRGEDRQEVDDAADPDPVPHAFGARGARSRIRLEHRIWNEPVVVADHRKFLRQHDRGIAIRSLADAIEHRVMNFRRRPRDI